MSGKELDIAFAPGSVAKFRGRWILIVSTGMSKTNFYSMLRSA